MAKGVASTRKTTLPELGLGLLAWYQRDAHPLPWRLLWKKTQNPFCVWVSEIMLQQTTIAAVWPKYESFMKRFPTVQSFAAAPLDEALQECRGLGYYRRFRMMHQAAKDLVNGVLPFQSLGNTSRAICEIIWPENDQEWLEVPGVGAYTAAAVSSITRGTMVPVIDGNVERVMQRVLGETFPGTMTQLKAHLRPLLNQMICTPSGDFNQGLMELGQRVCTKASPSCVECPLHSGCLAYAKGLQAEIPAAKVKPAPLEVALDMFIAADDKHIALHQRDGSYRFLPNTLGFHYQNATGKQPAKLLGRFKHSITKHRITVSVFLQELQGHGLLKADVEKALVSNLDRKALNVYLKGLEERDIFS